MERQHVEQREQDYWIAGSRVSLESVIFAFLHGFSPEALVAECFPVLSLEQVYGAITYSLSNRDEVDVYLQRMSADFDAFQQATNDPAFSRKMARARRQMHRPFKSRFDFKRMPTSTRSS